MMKTLILRTSFASVLMLFVATVAMAGNTKVDICHIPPGNPDNFHTITISEKAFSAHLAHGDIGGACDAACATLCDDGDACTIDDSGDCEQNGCPTTTVQVDCDDQNECTTNSCNPASGCVNTARLGESCDDNQTCSGPDACNAAGECQGAAIDNCCLGDEDCSGDLCDQASCNLGTNRCGNDPVVCNPPDLCSVSACASDTGECADSPIVCGDGESCNVANGECEPDVTVCPYITSEEPACPCFTADSLKLIADGFTERCNNGWPYPCDPYVSSCVAGTDAATGAITEYAEAGQNFCKYNEVTGPDHPATDVFCYSAYDTGGPEDVACKALVAAECADRGF